MEILAHADVTCGSHLQGLCSDYVDRGNVRVLFRCSVKIGGKKFIPGGQRSLLGGRAISPSQESVEFDVQADERGRPHATALKPVVGRKPSDCLLDLMAPRPISV